MKRAGGLLVALLLALAAGPGGGAGAQQVTDRERELAELRREIAELTQRRDRLTDRRSGLAGELEQLEIELALQQRRTAEAAAAGELAARQAAIAEGEMQRLAIRHQAARAALQRRVAGLYRLGRQGYLRLLLAADPDSEVLAAVRTVRYLARRDRLAAEGYRQAGEELATLADELEVRRRETGAWARREEARRGELASLRTRHRRLLAAVERERSEVAARAERLIEREAKLAEFLARLYDPGAAPLAGTPMAEFQGILDWPIAGEITVTFGPQRDPRYRTEVPHNGIEIATEPGAEVRAVYPGEVVFAAPFHDYGPTVVMLHARRAFSLYAGLTQLSVAKGDVLSLGEAVGTASDRLYFEIRLENRPQDPTDWLR